MGNEEIEKAFDELEEEIKARKVTAPSTTVVPTTTPAVQIESFSEDEIIKKEEETINEEKINAIVEKLKSMNFEYKLDKHNCHEFRYNKKLVVKVLPRKGCWYGVWRRVENDLNAKFKAFRIHNENEEAEFIDHVKAIVNLLSSS